ncbi:MAG: transposase [Chloroflexi bacterium]|nr:transposase [Chloroflexota bacterium]
MNLNTLKEFRQGIYGSFRKANDALFNLVDALLTEDRARSFPELSLSPHFERKWPSLYASLKDGDIDLDRLRQVFVTHLPQPKEGNDLWMAIDASGIARPKAVTSKDRSAQHVHNLPKCENPITYGWQFSTVVVLPPTPSSWTFTLDQQRISTETTAAQVAIKQLQALMPLVPQQTVRVLDRGYNSLWFWCQCSALPPKGTLIRLKNNRCFYREAPPPTGMRGAPRKDGNKLQPKDGSTHESPDGHGEGTDHKEHRVQLAWWKHLHVKDARDLDLTVIRVTRPHATNADRDPRVSWFVWIGQTLPDAELVQVALGYVKRFSEEHGYRFDKQMLLWEKPHLRTPAQFERWSQVVAIVRNHLVLARDLVEAELRPWENKQRSSTPQQVRRAMSKLLPQLGTPARPPQPRGKSPGRAKGTKMGKRTRFPVVKQQPKLPPLVPK